MDHAISPNRKKKFGPTRTKEVWKKSGGKCWYCGVRLTPPTSNTNIPTSYIDRMFTMDHIQPLSKGGTKALSNLVGACRKCNNRKGSGTVSFLRMKMIAERKHWPKFNQMQYEFLVNRGIDLSTLDHFEFYFERMKLK